jgi:polyphosphate:AMP phosphotransferase
MLDQMDLGQKLAKGEFKLQMDQMGIQLGELHRKIHDLGIPAIIVFEGWDAAGRGTLINELILRLDPRGFKVFANNLCHGDMAAHPFLWRYWNTTPAAGKIMIYDKSWYDAVLSDRIDGVTKNDQVPTLYNEIVSFERQLADSGCLLIKFFLHITKKEQKNRMDALESDPATRWRVGDVEWRRHRKYEESLALIEETLSRTDRDCSPWTPVAAMDRRFAAAKICQTVIDVIAQRIQRVESGKQAPPLTEPAVKPADVPTSILDTVTVPKEWKPDQYDKDLDRWGKKLHELHYETYKKKIPVLILFEGWDAAGKGGAIKRLVENFDPRGYEVTPVSAPNDTERAHHYLWRFWQAVPTAGRIAVFDRTWYGRVLVERVEGFCQETEWRRAYREINEFEEQLTNFGAVIVKFWLHIDKDEQLRRFEEREKTPEKSWKITAEDWRNREKWDDYKSAVDEMLFRTSSRKAPWTVVAANSKEYARLTVLRTVAEAMGKAL